MLFGHNSNVKVGETLYHVQTEDRGTSHAVIDTMVYQGGRVLHRRANSYADLLPLDSAREEALKLRVNTQHQTVLNELRTGALKLAQPVAPPVAAKASTPGAPQRIEGAAEPAQYSSATGLDGKAQVAFDMPRLGGGDCALVIEATNGKAQARLHFQLRAKPKVPAGG